MNAGYLVGAVIAGFLASPAVALDVESYERLVATSIEVVKSDEVDVEALLQYQDALIQLGVAGVQGFGEARPEFADAMDFVAAHAESMKSESLVSIEPNWHEGGALADAGIDTETLYDDDHASTYMEAVIHPATAHIATRAYALTGDDDYLDQVEFELEEIVAHFEDLKD